MRETPKAMHISKWAPGGGYVCGGFNGGSSGKYIQLIKDINRFTKEDYEKGIIARYHDESYFNKYIMSHEYKILPPGYAYPEEETLPFDCIALLKDKGKYGGHAWMRNETISWKRNILGWVKFLTKTVMG